MILFSPAKLNLFLRVVAKRADGYHDLATLMQAIDLGDTITITPSDKDDFSCSNSQLPMDEKNLVIKALRHFRSHTKLNTPVKINLDKRIPTQSGMGGGSSNAATTLWGLNVLFGSLSENDLSHLGSQLGSDVPFFFSQGRALCTGRGEIVQPLEIKENIYTIYHYPKGASTAQIFSRCTPAPVLENEIEKLVKNHQIALPSFINDLEPITEALLPEISNWKRNLPAPAVMTGSGSAYYCEGNKPLSGESSWHVRTIYRQSDSWY